MCNIMQARMPCGSPGQQGHQRAPRRSTHSITPFHDLEGADKTGSQRRSNLLKVPATLGTMQCVEHAHAIPAGARRRVPEGLPAFDCDVECRELCNAFRIS
jgi:hypothetical protein